MGFRAITNQPRMFNRVQKKQDFLLEKFKQTPAQCA